MRSNGSVTNGSASVPTALISGIGGVKIGAGGGTVANDGTISGEVGVRGEAGGTITNGSANVGTAYIFGSSWGILIDAGVATIANYGTIRGGYGIFLNSSGSGIINAAAGQISGSRDGIFAKAAQTPSPTLVISRALPTPGCR